MAVSATAKAVGIVRLLSVTSLINVYLLVIGGYLGHVYKFESMLPMPSNCPQTMGQSQNFALLAVPPEIVNSTRIGADGYVNSVRLKCSEFYPPTSGFYKPG